MRGLWVTLNRREKAFLGACLYLAALFVSCVTMWWLVLIGGTPFVVENIATVSNTGMPTERFKAGQVAGIKRKVCSDGSVGARFYPSLVDSRGFMFPLPGSMVQTQPGCSEITYGFIVPDLPPGEYSYSSTITYQNNLIGRDESETFPLLRLRITR